MGKPAAGFQSQKQRSHAQYHKLQEIFDGKLHQEKGDYAERVNISSSAILS